LDLIQGLVYRVSGFEESKDLTLLHFELPVTEIRYGQDRRIRGRFAAVDLSKGKISGFGV
jgi:hypothetical protein